MAFKFIPGCNCCGCGTDTVTVKGCSNVVFPGVLVELKSGATTLASATTDSSGIAAIAIPAAGTYTYVLTPPGDITGARYNSFSQPGVPLTCATSSRTFTLGVKSGYVCCGGLTPVKTTLFLTTPAGILTMTSGGSGLWQHVGTQASAPRFPVESAGGLCTAAQTAAVAVAYTLTCSDLKQRWPLNDCCLVAGQGPSAIYGLAFASHPSGEEQALSSLANVAFGPVIFTFLGTSLAATTTGFCPIAAGCGAPHVGDHVVSE